MLRHKKEERQKDAIRGLRAYSLAQDTFYASMYSIPVAPYQLGFKRFFVLREDYSLRSDAQDIKRALDLVNTTVYCPREDFMRYSITRNQFFPIVQIPKALSVREFEERCKTDKMQSFFLYQRVEMSRGPAGEGFDVHLIPQYVFCRQHLIEFHTEPNIVTTRRVVDDLALSVFQMAQDEYRAKRVELGRLLWGRESEPDIRGHRRRKRLDRVVPHDYTL